MDTDSRRRGRNRYANVICKSFDIIHRLLTKGKSRNAIFRFLQNNGVFDEEADVSTFYRVLKRELRRRGIKFFSPTQQIQESGNGGVAEGVEYVRAGKRYAMWKGEELFIPEGACFSRGMVRPKGKDFGAVETDKTEKRYSFSDYPKHIQEAMEANLAQYPKLEAGKMNRELVAQWKKDGAKN